MGNTFFIRKHVLILFFLCLLTTNLFAQEKLYVFYPTISNPEIIKDLLEKHVQRTDVLVFSKHDDFITKVKADLPDAIITKTVLIFDQLGNYEVLLNGQRNGKAETRYVILSINKSLNIESINTSTVIGVVNFLGRTGMGSFTKQFFSTAPRLKRVSKVGDLLPLLSLNIAAGILIEDVFVDYFKSTSQLNFFVTPLPVIINGTVGFAVKKERKADKAVNILKKNDKEICDLFHIQQWK